MNDVPELSEEIVGLDSSLDFFPVVIEVETPKPEDMPIKAQQILCLMACGFSPASIGRLLKVTPQAVSNMADKYDPQRQVTLTSKERRAFIARLWQARGLEALMHMTPEKLEEADAASLARVAGMATKFGAEEVAQEKPKNPYDIIEALGRDV